MDDIIKEVTKCGIKITNVTFDGYSGNVPMCEILGANLDVFSDHFKPFINNPSNNEKIYITPDACHMEKLVRNTLASKKVFYDANNNRIEWRYIEALHEYTLNHDFRTHKLTKKHVHFKRNIMNVRIAAQTFSLSVANSILFLMEQNVPEFQDAWPTIKFIRRMDKLFNVFNSRQLDDKNIFKRALSASNKRIIFDFLTECIEFFKTLKIQGEVSVRRKSKAKKANKTKKTGYIIKKTKKMILLLKSKNKCSFRGFIIGAHSIMRMYKEYVEDSQHLISICTYNLLQDVIELLFGRIRACGGFNNNPNIQQFQGAYRKVQCNMKLDLSPGSNCRVFDSHLPENLFFSNIFFVSSKRARITMNSNTYGEQRDTILHKLSEMVEFDIDETYDTVDITTILSRYTLDGGMDFMVKYIACSIEKKITECGSFHCNMCRSVFDENEKINQFNSIFFDHTPCTSTVDICRTAEKYFKLYNVKRSEPVFDFKLLYCLICWSMNLNNLYSESKFDCDHNHRYQLIKCIVGQYISIRANQVSKQTTFDMYDTFMRQHCNHLVLYKGQ